MKWADGANVEQDWATIGLMGGRRVCFCGFLVYRIVLPLDCFVQWVTG